MPSSAKSSCTSFTGRPARLRCAPHPAELLTSTSTSERDGARDTITRIERRMAAIDADIDALTKHTGQESIESLEAALRLRRETEATRRGRVSALESIWYGRTVSGLVTVSNPAGIRYSELLTVNR